MASHEERLAEENALRSRGNRLPRKPLDLIPQRSFAEEIKPVNAVDSAAETLAAIKRQSKFIMLPFSGTTLSVLLRPEEDRSYFLIQNTSASGVLYVSFGNGANPASSIQIAAGGYYEPYQVPQNDVYISSSVNGVTGVMAYAN